MIRIGLPFHIFPALPTVTFAFLRTSFSYHPPPSPPAATPTFGSRLRTRLYSVHCRRLHSPYPYHHCAAPLLTPAAEVRLQISTRTSACPPHHSCLRGSGRSHGQFRHSCRRCLPRRCPDCSRCVPQEFSAARQGSGRLVGAKPAYAAVAISAPAARPLPVAAPATFLAASRATSHASASPYATPHAQISCFGTRPALAVSPVFFLTSTGRVENCGASPRRRRVF